MATLTRNSADSAVSDVLLILLALIVPPVAVFMEVGLSGQFWLNLVLTLLLFIPGMLHAIWVVVTR